MKDLKKRNTLAMITLLAKKCEIVKANSLYCENRNIITKDEYLKAYAKGVDAYYQE